MRCIQGSADRLDTVIEASQIASLQNRCCAWGCKTNDVAPRFVADSPSGANNRPRFASKIFETQPQLDPIPLVRHRDRLVLICTKAAPLALPVARHSHLLADAWTLSLRLPFNCVLTCDMTNASRRRVDPLGTPFSSRCEQTADVDPATRGATHHALSLQFCSVEARRTCAESRCDLLGQLSGCSTAPLTL